MTGGRGGNVINSGTPFPFLVETINSSYVTKMEAVVSIWQSEGVQKIFVNKRFLNSEGFSEKLRYKSLLLLSFVILFRAVS
jgi:hypothetical protein